MFHPNRKVFLRRNYYLIEGPEVHYEIPCDSLRYFHRNGKISSRYFYDEFGFLRDSSLHYSKKGNLEYIKYYQEIQQMEFSPTWDFVEAPSLVRYEHFDENGKLEYTQQFKDGLGHGTWLVYHKGMVIQEVRYESGKEVEILDH